MFGTPTKADACQIAAVPQIPVIRENPSSDTCFADEASLLSTENSTLPASKNELDLRVVTSIRHPPTFGIRIALSIRFLRIFERVQSMETHLRL